MQYLQQKKGRCTPSIHYFVDDVTNMIAFYMVMPFIFYKIAF